jgi:threonyl-tRNA synthetase
MQLTFPDKSVRQYEDGMTAFDIAESISPRLKKSTLVCELDGNLYDAFAPITGDHDIRFLDFSEEGGRWAFRHTASHILAQAVKRLYPDTVLAIGPAIDTGFYYDFDRPEPFTPEDLVKIEKEREKIAK